MTNNVLKLERLERHACFGGSQEVWQHYSPLLDSKMNFAIYLPPQVQRQKLPVLYWLSGLTCNEQNMITKSGMQQYAAKLGVIIVAPDTSPRGDSIPDDTDYDLGQGAGFYVNATQSPWQKNYHMYDYILSELPQLIVDYFPATDKKSIFGHSMGGHGALVLALRNPEHYSSVSAFSPIVTPSQVAWGQKAFSAYLGDDRAIWEQYDAVKLIEQNHVVPEIFIDQGLADPFYKEQLHTKQLETACINKKIKTLIRYHDNYDHSYYFISSFIGEHIAYHANRLSFL